TVDLRVDDGASAPERSFSTNSNTGAARLIRSLCDRARRRLTAVDGCSATALIFRFRISDFGLQISRNQSTKHKAQSTKTQIPIRIPQSAFCNRLRFHRV